MRGHGEKITRKQEQAIAALLTDTTMEAAAHRVGIGESTLWRWLKDPSFQAEYRLARRHVVEHAVSRLQQATKEAVSALQRNLTCGNPSSEVQAARVILEQAVKAIELIDLVARVDNLERLLMPGEGEHAPW